MTLTPQYDPDSSFKVFWSAFPKHVAKKDAIKAWTKLNPSPALVTEILTALSWQTLSAQWQTRDFVPHPASYIRGHRWEDEPPKHVTRVMSVDWWSECQSQHGGQCESRYTHGLKMGDAR